jgi:hypothetical protein
VSGAHGAKRATKRCFLEISIILKLCRKCTLRFDFMTDSGKPRQVAGTMTKSLVSILASYSCLMFAACTVDQDLGQRSPDSGKAPDETTGSSGGTSSSSGGTKGACGGMTACDPNMSESSCTALGCSYAPPTCTGTANACASISLALCAYVPGCAVRNIFGNDTCAGQAVACDERAITGGCDSVMGKSGCLNAGGCTGGAQDCSKLSLSDCTSYPGCSVK